MLDFTHLIETTQSSSQVYQGSFLKVMHDKVLLPNGHIAVREYIRHPRAAAVLALTTDNKIILEYQYRYPTKQTLLEIPAGKIDNPETPLECAKRELLEETGYIAKNWVLLGECLPCIAYSDEKISYFLATDLHLTQSNLDAGELLQVTTMDVEEFINLAYLGKIQDSKTLSGIMLYLGYARKINK